MQALGAYGFRGFYERKVHFLQSVPYALKNLRWLLHNVKLPIALPTLTEAFRSMVGSEKLQRLATDADNLVVRISSFSFHRGWPNDESGNGGGFVFDGRSLPNPGREERFKALTGKDVEVIEYLNQQETVHQFFANALSLVESAVEQLSESRFQEPDGCIRMHRRSASLGLSCRTTREATPWSKWRRSRCATPGIGECCKMRAMVLAAGLGTRLRSLTHDRPKALVTVAGRTLLEITLQRLRSFGIRDVIINVHHFADTVIDYLKSNDYFGMHLEVSREDVLLDTGGGLKQAAGFFLDSPDRDQPFILHNVDVVSTIDLAKMLKFHSEQKALATLATQHRSSSRYLLFDGNHQLCGRRKKNEPPEMVREATSLDAVGFCGVHVIAPKLLERNEGDRRFLHHRFLSRIAPPAENP